MSLYQSIFFLLYSIFSLNDFKSIRTENVSGGQINKSAVNNFESVHKYNSIQQYTKVLFPSHLSSADLNNMSDICLYHKNITGKVDNLFRSDLSVEEISSYIGSIS